MEDPGQKLKRVRERLHLRYRDVEEASIQIANRRKNDEFIIALSRLSDIENKGTVPSIYRLYSLCTIYRLSFLEVLDWYGVSLAAQAADAASISIARTHPIGFDMQEGGMIPLPMPLDPGIDLKKTVLLSRMIQRWGWMPMALLGSNDIKHLRYAFVGSEDWSMYPLIQPESLILIDESQKKIPSSGWTSEYERPIYFLEHRHGYSLGWCTVMDKHITVLPHPSSSHAPLTFPLDEVDILGQVTGVAMHLDQWKRRPSHA